MRAERSTSWPSRWASISKSFLFSLGLFACSESGGVDANLDGNVVVGDALASDSFVFDAEELDGGEIGLDGSQTDGDAAFVDASSFDAGTDGGVFADVGTPDAGSPCLLPPEETLTPTEAVSRAAMLDGRVVAIVGTSTIGPLTCTASVCAPQMPCCNGCVGPVLLGQNIELLESACFPDVSCSGDECTQVCTPPIFDLPQTFIGRLRDQSGQTHAVGLELFSVH